MRKWTCTIIQRDGKYRAVMLIDNKEVDYRTLSQSIKQITGKEVTQ